MLCVLRDFRHLYARLFRMCLRTGLLTWLRVSLPRPDGIRRALQRMQLPVLSARKSLEVLFILNTIIILLFRRR
jgi:hypothetical protein